MNAVTIDTMRKARSSRNLNFGLGLWVLATLCVVFTFGATVTFPLFFLFGSLLTLAPLLLVIFIGQPINGLMLSALFIVCFNAFYHPVFGVLSGAMGWPTGLYRYALGVRSAWYCLALMLVCWQLVRKHDTVRKRMAIPIAVLLGFLMVNAALSGGPMSARSTYLLNSFLPLAFTLVGAAAVFSGVRISENDARFLLRLLGVITFLGFVHFVLLPLTYDVFRPDLASFMRVRPGEMIPRGGYDPSWGTRIAGYTFNRFVGSFPDPIIAGYFFGALAFVSYAARQKLFMFWFGFLLAISLSKGAWLFFVQSVALLYIYRRYPRLLFLAVPFMVAGQLTLASVIESSNKMHLLGLIGGVSSVIQGGPKSMLIGYGVGEGGNLARSAVEGGGLGEGWLGSGSESGVGVLAHQLGVIGFALLLWCVWRVLTTQTASGQGDDQGVRRFIRDAAHAPFAGKALLISLIINSFLQENCINASLLSTVLLSICIVHGLGDRAAPRDRKPSLRGDGARKAAIA